MSYFYLQHITEIYSVSAIWTININGQATTRIKVCQSVDFLVKEKPLRIKYTEKNIGIIKVRMNPILWVELALFR